MSDAAPLRDLTVELEIRQNELYLAMGVVEEANGHDYGRIEFHHLVARIHGGDDVEDNIVPVHFVCHERVTMRDHIALAAVAESLSESERGYVLRKLGPAGYRRLFGVEC